MGGKPVRYSNTEIKMSLALEIVGFRISPRDAIRTSAILWQRSNPDDIA